jgi:hypothetical protein
MALDLIDLVEKIRFLLVQYCCTFETYRACSFVFSAAKVIQVNQLCKYFLAKIQKNAGLVQFSACIYRENSSTFAENFRQYV